MLKEAVGEWFLLEIPKALFISVGFFFLPSAAVKIHRAQKVILARGN